jgi:hypothetical protein
MNEITGQVIYAGPTVPGVFGLKYNTLFKNGVTKNVYEEIKRCPSIRGLIVPVEQFAQVRKELNFDIARNMRGTTGKFVEFYLAIQKWIATRKPPTQTTGVKLQTHA